MHFVLSPRHTTWTPTQPSAPMSGLLTDSAVESRPNRRWSRPGPGGRGAIGGRSLSRLSSLRPGSGWALARARRHDPPSAADSEGRPGRTETPLSASGRPRATQWQPRRRCWPGVPLVLTRPGRGRSESAGHLHQARRCHASLPVRRQEKHRNWQGAATATGRRPRSRLRVPGRLGVPCHCQW